MFSEEGKTDLQNNEKVNNSLASAGIETITMLLTIDFLPCAPDEQVLLTAWEDILPWVCLVESVHYGMHVTKLISCSVSS